MFLRLSFCIVGLLRHLVILTWAFALAAVSAQESDTKSKAGLDVATVQEFDSLDRIRDGSLDETEFAFSEIAQRVREAGRQKMLPQIFEQIDRDGNGSIELLEFAQSRQNRNARLLDRTNGRNFIKSDTDQDGLISLDEYLARPSAKEANFQRIDLNKNENVGPFEWMHGLREAFMDREKALPFCRLDRNDDGAISSDEFEKGTPPSALEGAFEEVDLNGNREIGPEEFAKALAQPAGQPGIPPHLVTAFEKIDRNRDRGISLREFERNSPIAKMGKWRKGPGELKPENVFGIMDANGDGEISLSEFTSTRNRVHAKGGPGPGPKKGRPKGPPKRGPKR